MRRRRLGLFVLGFVAFAASNARADDPLAACIDDALGVLRAQGGTPVGEPVVGFLAEGEKAAHVFELPDEGCVGFLVAGHGRVQDIDLHMHTATGIELGRDDSSDPFAYQRYCGAKGLRLAITVQMYKGRGEYRLAALTRAPPVLPDLNRKVGGCFASIAGKVEPPLDVGPEPPHGSIETTLASIERELSPLGYLPFAPDQKGSLLSGHTTHRTIVLEKDRCYAIAAAGGPTVGDLDLIVRGAARGSTVQDVSPRREGIVKLCTDTGGLHHVLVRMHAGMGEWALRFYVLEEPSDVGEDRLEGIARLGYAEMARRIEARGMKTSSLGWGFVAPGFDLGRPVELEGGRCYAFGAIGAEELSAADLDLVLVDETGARVAWDLGFGADPLVFHCPERSGAYRVIGRVWGGRGRYLTVLGEATPGGES